MANFVKNRSFYPSRPCRGKTKVTFAPFFFSLHKYAGGYE
jgi:hypothetical protein